MLRYFVAKISKTVVFLSLMGSNVNGSSLRSQKNKSGILKVLKLLGNNNFLRTCGQRPEEKSVYTDKNWMDFQ